MPQANTSAAEVSAGGNLNAPKLVSVPGRVRGRELEAHPDHECEQGLEHGHVEPV